MPIRTEHIEAGIYCAHWIDEVTPNDIYFAGDEIQAMANADEVETYMLLINGTRIRKIPVQLNSYLKSTRKEVYAILALNAPALGEVIGRVFNRLMPMQVEFFRDEQTWRARAYEVHAEKVGKQK